MNDELIKQKELTEEEYLKIQNIYKQLLENYILTKIDLRKYDSLIKDSNLDFGIPHPKETDLTNNLNLNYIYLINRLFVEKLNGTDLNILKKYLANDLKDTSLLNSVIERTYKDVIKDNYLDGEYKDSNYKVCYGIASPNNFVDNDALVFKIFYSKNTNKYTDEEFLNNLEKKKEFLNTIEENLIKEIKEKLNINCNIIIEKIPY